MIRIIIMNSQPNSSEDYEDMRKDFPKNHVFKVRKERALPIWVPGNEEKCRAHLCVIDDGRVMLADRTNKTLKILDTKSGVRKEFCVPAPYTPLSVCHLRNNEFVVGMRINSADTQRKILIFEIVDGKMMQTREFLVSHGCGIIRFHRGNLYISSDLGLFVYSVSGALKEVLIQDGCPEGYMGFDFSNSGRTMIYVCHFTESVVTTIDDESRQLATWTENDLEFTTGIAVHPTGAVFACGSNADIVRVFQLSQDGSRKVGTLYEQPYTDLWPLAIAYNSYTDELIVVGDGDSIRVLTLA